MNIMYYCIIWNKEIHANTYIQVTEQNLCGMIHMNLSALFLFGEKK